MAFEIKPTNYNFKTNEQMIISYAGATGVEYGYLYGMGGVINSEKVTSNTFVFPRYTKPGVYTCYIGTYVGQNWTQSNSFTINISEDTVIPPVENNPPIIGRVVVSNEDYNGSYMLSYNATDKDNDTLVHKLKIDNGNYTVISPTKNNTEYKYAGSGLSQGNHVGYIQVGDGKTVAESSPFNIVIISKPTSIKVELKQAKDHYDLKHKELKDIIASIVADGKYDPDIEKTSLDLAFNNYNDSLVKYKKITQIAVDAIAQKKSDDVKVSVEKEIEDLNTALGGLENTMNNAFKDGVLSSSEKLAIKQHLQTISIEKVDVDKKYEAVYNNEDLIGVSKTNLKVSYDGYVSNYNSLVSAINTIINKTGILDNTDQSNLNSAFNNYRSASGEYSKRINEAIDSIAKKKADDAEANANIHTNAQIKLVKDEISLKVSQETFDNNNKVISEKFTEIKQTTDGITLRVEKTEQNTSLNSIINSNFGNNPKHKNWGLWSEHGGGSYYEVQYDQFPKGEGIGLKAGLNEACTMISNTRRVVKGDKLTLSADLFVEQNVSSASMCIREFDINGNTLNDTKWDYPANYNGRTSNNIEIVDSNTIFVCFLLWNNGAITSEEKQTVVFINRVQLESGSKPNPWKLSNIDNLDHKFTEIKQTTDSIFSTVSNIKNDYASKSSVTQLEDSFNIKFEQTGKELNNSMTSINANDGVVVRHSDGGKSVVGSRDIGVYDPQGRQKVGFFNGGMNNYNWYENKFISRTGTVVTPNWKYGLGFLGSDFCDYMNFGFDKLVDWDGVDFRKTLSLLRLQFKDRPGTHVTNHPLYIYDCIDMQNRHISYLHSLWFNHGYSNISILEDNKGIGIACEEGVCIGTVDSEYGMRAVVRVLNGGEVATWADWWFNGGTIRDVRVATTLTGVTRKNSGSESEIVGVNSTSETVQHSGSGEIVNGKCIIDIPPALAENINGYTVILSKCDKGDVYCKKTTRERYSFIVEGDDIEFEYLLIGNRRIKKTREALPAPTYYARKPEPIRQVYETYSV